MTFGRSHKEEVPDETDNIVRLHLGIPLDASGYLRHECPTCMLEFKIASDEMNLVDAVSSWCYRAVGIEPERKDVDVPSARLLRCPYCPAEGKPQDFFHAEIQSFLLHVARREIVEPMVSTMLSKMEESFGSVKGDSVKITFERSGNGRSPRPLAGPEPDDMVRVRCGQCDERFKLVEGWTGDVTCPACFTSLHLG